MSEEGSRKKSRLDNGTAFKGMPNVTTSNNTDSLLVPTLPASRSGTQRQRVEDTPSRGPGLSEKARLALEEHRRSREAQRCAFQLLS